MRRSAGQSTGGQIGLDSSNCAQTFVPGDGPRSNEPDQQNQGDRCARTDAAPDLDQNGQLYQWKEG